MTTKPSTGRRARKDADETDLFDHRRQDSRAGVAKAAKRRARRRARRAGRRGSWTE